MADDENTLSKQVQNNSKSTVLFWLGTNSYLEDNTDVGEPPSVVEAIVVNADAEESRLELLALERFYQKVSLAHKKPDKCAPDEFRGGSCRPAGRQSVGIHRDKE